jgi:hypothetical protein
LAYGGTSRNGTGTPVIIVSSLVLGCDDINKQRMEIWKAGNISNESATADFMEKELKFSEEEANALEERNPTYPGPIRYSN